MAKQKAETVEARKSQLIELGFILTDEGYKKGKVTITMEIIETNPKKDWEGIVKGINIAAESDAIPFAEEIPDDSRKHELMLAEGIQREVAKLDTNMVAIAELKEKYKGLTIKDVNDKEGYKAMKAAKADIRSKRTKVEAKRKEINADFIAYQRGVNEKAKEYTGLLVEIETPIDTALEQYEKWEKEEEERKEKEASRVLDERVAALLEAGASFTGAYYGIGESIAMDVVTLKGMKDSDFEFLLQKVKLEKIKIDEKAAADAEEKRKADEAEAERQRKLKEDEDELKRKQDKQKADEEKLKKEQEDMRKERLQMRGEMADNAGLKFNPATLAYDFSNKYYEVSISKDFMDTADSAVYSAKIKEVAGLVKIAVTNAETAQKKEEEDKAKLAQRRIWLTNLGFVLSNGIYFIREANPDIQIKESSVEIANDQAWETMQEGFTNQVKAHFAEIERVKKEKEDKEEADRIQFQNRTAQLANMGLMQTAIGFSKKDQFGNEVSVLMKAVKETPAEDWEEYIVLVTGELSELAGKTAAKVKEIEDKRQEAMPEAEKIRAYIAALKAVPVPEIKVQEMKNVIVVLESDLDAVINNITKYLSDVESK